jgi:hypothetical protein
MQTTDAIRLHCLAGEPAPPLVTEGWSQLEAIPDTSRPAFWMLLIPILTKPGDAANQNLLALFCKEYNLQPESVLAAIGCCELLFKQAAALDLTPDRFQEDLKALNGGEPAELIRFMGERFPEAKQRLRRGIFEESLATHGKVMTGLAWRLDTVLHSSQGTGLNSDIVMLTLTYREGDRDDRITLQLTREAALELKAFCDRLPQQDKS